MIEKFAKAIGFGVLGIIALCGIIFVFSGMRNLFNRSNQHHGEVPHDRVVAYADNTTLPPQRPVYTTEPLTYGGRDGTGFYIWVPPAPDWSVWIDPSGERTDDQKQWGNSPGQPGKVVNDPAGSDHGAWTHPELLHLSHQKPKYFLVYDRVDKTVPVVTAFNGDLERTYELPLKNSPLNRSTQAFQSRSLRGTWMHVCWEKQPQ